MFCYFLDCLDCSFEKMNLINMFKSLFLTRIAAPEDTPEESGPSQKRPRVEFVCRFGYRAKNLSLLKRHELVHLQICL